MEPGMAWADNIVRLHVPAQTGEGYAIMAGGERFKRWDCARVGCAHLRGYAGHEAAADSCWRRAGGRCGVGNATECRAFGGGAALLHSMHHDLQGPGQPTCQLS